MIRSLTMMANSFSFASSGFTTYNRRDYYRLFVPNVPNVGTISERFANEADAQRAKRTILMMYPAATVRIEKTDESGRAK